MKRPRLCILRSTFHLHAINSWSCLFLGGVHAHNDVQRARLTSDISSEGLQDALHHDARSIETFRPPTLRTPFLCKVAVFGHNCIATDRSIEGISAYPLAAPPSRVVRVEEAPDRFLEEKGAIHDLVTSSCTSRKKGTGPHQETNRPASRVQDMVEASTRAQLSQRPSRVRLGHCHSPQRGQRSHFNPRGLKLTLRYNDRHLIIRRSLE